MRAQDRPIGVFDSGLGGLTVFQALSRLLPRENLVYFGDTAHVPYGSKSQEAVTRYSVDVARFLSKQGIKALVVACNTSSALALPAIEKAAKVPVIGVIEAGAEAAADTAPASAGARRVGVIGTEATISSGAYDRAVKKRLPSAEVVSAACPLFVPLVEEGWWSDSVTTEVAKRYLAPLKGIDTLILGCTHYPVIKGTIAKVLPKVKLVDSAEETAKQTEAALRRLGLLRPSGKGRHRYFVSDAPERFLKLSRRFLGKPVKAVRA